MKRFSVHSVAGENVGEAAKAVARRQAEQLTLVRRRAQPTTVYIARLTVTAVFAYLVAQQLPGGSARDVVAPLTALLVAQATLFQTVGSAVRRVAAVTAGVLAAVVVSTYVPFSWWVLGLLIAVTLTLGIVLRLREEIVEVPISAMVIFSVGSNSAASSRIIETLVGAAVGLAGGLVLAPLRVQPAKEAVGELTRQMADLLSQMANGLAEAPDPRRAAEWLDRTRALRGEIERVDDALAEAEESIRLNPRRLRFGNPAAGLRDSLGTLERAAADMRVLARSVTDSTRLESDDSPVRDTETRARLSAMLAELSAAVRAYGQLLEADPAPEPYADHVAEPITEQLEDHLGEAKRQQDQLAALLRTDPAERPEGWPLRGEILSQVDRLRSELEPDRLPDQPRVRSPRQALWELQAVRELRALRDRHRSSRPAEVRHPKSRTAPRREPTRPALRVRAKRTAARARPRRQALPAPAAPGVTGGSGPARAAADARVSRGARPRRCGRPGRAGKRRSGRGGTPATGAARAAPPPPPPRRRG